MCGSRRRRKRWRQHVWRLAAVTSDRQCRSSTTLVQPELQRTWATSSHLRDVITELHDVITHLRDVRPTVSFFDDPRAAGAAALLRNQSPGGSNSTAGADSGRGASSEEGRETPTKRRQSRLVASSTSTTSTSGSTTTVTVDIRPNGQSNFVRLDQGFIQHFITGRRRCKQEPGGVTHGYTRHLLTYLLTSLLSWTLMCISSPPQIWPLHFVQQKSTI